MALFEAIEQIRILSFYWKSPQFRKIDQAFRWSYCFENYFRISKNYWIDQGEKEVDIYGETPLTTLNSILAKANITKEDKFFDLGCGRGRTLFFVSEYLGADATGIEVIPYFVEKGNALSQKFDLAHVHFIQGDYLDADLSSATVVYLFALFLTEEEELRLIKALSRMPKGARLLTVSFPVEEIDKGGHFDRSANWEEPFNWGSSEVFLQYRNEKN